MATDVLTNMQVLKPSRVKPRLGDLFILYIEGRYLFGRVINTEAKAGWSMPGAILIYIYRSESTTIEPPDRSKLKPANLLLPPMMTNRLAWSKGYFQTISNVPLEPDDVLPQHCFRSANGDYFDEFATEIPRAVEPCGDWGLHSFRTIDDEVSDALGIPNVP